MRFPRRRRKPRRRAAPREQQTVRALLDFGASRARAALARLTPSGVEILGAAEVTGRSGMARPGQVMRQEAISTLVENALTTAEWATAQDGTLPSIADDAIVGLTGPLLTAERHVRHLRRTDPIAPIFENEILEALKQVQRENLQALKEEIERGKIRRTLVASALVGAMSVREDTLQAERLPDVSRGVPGIAGDYLSVAICNLTWPAKGLEMLSRVLEDLELDLFETAPIAQAVAAALPMPDAILIDIGHEHTELSLAEGGSLSDLVTVPLGGQFFTKTLTNNLRLSETHAELIKRPQRRNQNDFREDLLSRLLGRAAEKWYGAVEHALLELSGEAPLPPRIYLYGGGAQLPEVIEQLRVQPWTRRLPFERHPILERLMPHQLRGLHDPRGFFNSTAYVGIAALAVWAGHEASPLQNALDEITDDLITDYDLG